MEDHKGVEGKGKERKHTRRGRARNVVVCGGRLCFVFSCLRGEKEFIGLGRVGDADWLLVTAR